MLIVPSCGTGGMAIGLFGAWRAEGRSVQAAQRRGTATSGSTGMNTSTGGRPWWSMLQPRWL